MARDRLVVERHGIEVELVEPCAHCRSRHRWLVSSLVTSALDLGPVDLPCGHGLVIIAFAEPPLPKVYCFIAGPGWIGRDNIEVVALAEDGTYLGGHISSSLDHAKRDIGHLPGTHQKTRHADFRRHYPRGFVTEWVDDPKNPSLGLARALDLNRGSGE